MNEIHQKCIEKIMAGTDEEAETVMALWREMQGQALTDREQELIKLMRADEALAKVLEEIAAKYKKA